MDISMAQGGAASGRVEGWRWWAGTVCAWLLAVLFVVAGLWKLSDPLSTTARMVQALVPVALALPAALAAGIVEAWAGILLLIPKWRRWGALLCGAMLVVFMVYFAAFYNRLKGEDCTCFPWLERVVGPEFFIGDGIMLLLAAGAWVWALPSRDWKPALAPLAVCAVLAGGFYAQALRAQTGLEAPAEILVDGKPVSLRHGRVLLYFFDPECSHCHQVAVRLGKREWQNVKLIALPTVNPQWGKEFVEAAGFPADISSDAAKLRATFKFTDPPFGVALEHGRQIQALPFLDAAADEAALEKLGWIK
jgi:uncharacterized membrane protein YphA (DoxX/SURF4 family)